MAYEDKKQKVKEKAGGFLYKAASTPSRLKQKARDIKQGIEIKAASTDPQVFVHDFFTRPLFALAEEATKAKFDEAADKAEKKLADSFFTLEDLVQEAVTKKLAEKQAELFIKRYPHLVTGSQSQIKLTYGKPWRGITPTRYRAKEARASKYDPVEGFERGAEMRGLRSKGRRLESKRSDRISAEKVKQQVAATMMQAMVDAQNKMEKKLK